jgi:hypothetical protein
MQVSIKTLMYVLLEQAGFIRGAAKSLWLEALRYACQIKNATRVIPGCDKVPDAAFTLGRQITKEQPLFLANTAPFGCAGVAYKSARDKMFQQNGIAICFVGFSSGFPYATIRAWNPRTRKIVDTEHYTLDRHKKLVDIDILPVSLIQHLTTGHSSLYDDYLDEGGEPLNFDTDDYGVVPSPTIMARPPIESTSDTSLTTLSQPTKPATVTRVTSLAQNLPTTITTNSPIATNSLLRRSARLAPRFKHHIAPTPRAAVPRNSRQAWQDAFWKDVLCKELDPMHGTIFDICSESSVPPAEQIFDTICVFKYKRDGRGKARCNLDGREQIAGLDFDRTDSPVVRWETMLILFYMMNKLGIPMASLDAVQAFTQVPLHHPVYVKPVPGYHDHLPPGSVLKLKIMLYGMHQASREWYLELTGWLKEEGFHPSLYDQGLWIKRVDTDTIYFPIYVDDNILICANPVLRSSFVAAYRLRFNITECDEVDDFLGIEIDYDHMQGTLRLHQSQAIHQFLDKWGYSVRSCRTSKTPAIPNTRLPRNPKDSAFLDPIRAGRFRSIIGGLIDNDMT